VVVMVVVKTLKMKALTRARAPSRTPTPSSPPRLASSRRRRTPPPRQVRSIHWFPYDRVRVVNADP
jgi:hypothetical protein